MPWRAFVKVADTLVADFDIIEFLNTLAEFGGIDTAFTALRGYARDRNLKLAEVARAVAAGDLDIPLPAGCGPPVPGSSPAG